MDQRRPHRERTSSNRRKAAAPQGKTSLIVRSVSVLGRAVGGPGGAGLPLAASARRRREDGEHDQPLIRVVANPVGDPLGRDQHLARLHGNFAILE